MNIHRVYPYAIDGSGVYALRKSEVEGVVVRTDLINSINHKTA